MIKNLILLPVVVTLIGIQASWGPIAQGATAATATPAAPYSVDITPADFVPEIDNPYLPLIPGAQWVYEATLEDGSTERIEVEVLHETREVNGVTATIVHDQVFVAGELVEDTHDWYAQDKTGNVWYLGEAVDNYENGVLANHDGSWEWGVDGALPGIVMWADPAAHLDEEYYQEYYVGEAEDKGQVLSVGEVVTISVGSFGGVVQTYDFSSLDGDIQSHKFYAPGIGTIKEVELLTGEEVMLIDYTPADKITCAPVEGEPVEIATAKLYVEYNYTDEDLGVHGAFDDHGWSELCVYAPNGQQVLAVKPQSQLKDLTMAGIFFESREPPTEEFTFADLKANFPEGQYEVRGTNFDGTGLTGAATFSHNVPAPPEITFPPLAEDEEAAAEIAVPVTDLGVEWEDVIETVDGTAVTITGYEVIITKVENNDPHGYSRPAFDVHVPGDRNSLTVPIEFLEPETLYELEILALEESGNQTITVGFFTTE